MISVREVADGGGVLLFANEGLCGSSDETCSGTGDACVCEEKMHALDFGVSVGFRRLAGHVISALVINTVRFAAKLYI